MKRVVAFVFLAGLLVLGGAARAQDAGAIERAKTLFNAGAQAYAAGEYATAIQAFEEAYKIAPRPQIMFSLAQAERKHYFATKRIEVARSAIAHYRRYLDDVPTGGRRADAVDAIAELEPLVGRGETSAEPAAPREEDRTRLMVSSETPGARASVDGAAFAVVPVVASVSPGNHRVRVSADGYFDEERNIVAVKGSLVPAEVLLREKPAVVSFEGGAGADVIIDGRFVGVAPLARPIELASGTHSIVFVKNGYHAAALAPKLVHGEQISLPVRLRTTGQRFASYVLLATGLAAAAGGGVAAGLAIQTQDNARRIQDDRARGNITASALADYNTSIESRDQWRAFAFVGFSASAALLATSAFLFAFDRPSASALPESDAPRNAPAPMQRGPLDVMAVPALSPGMYGASVTGRF